jgi:hypothetical protein
MRAFAGIAETRIQAAIADGDLDDLPGSGKPLPRDDISRVPAELRMGYRILRNADCLPPELEARKEVARLGALIESAGDRAEREHLSRLRQDAELRYAVLMERRRR